jgi:hypothetical protein
MAKKDFIDEIEGMDKQYVVDLSIKRKVRTAEDFKEDPLFNCDVCYTCKFFNASYSECFLFQKNVKRMDKVNLIWDEFFVRTRIKKPEWYRCMWWKESV